MKTKNKLQNEVTKKGRSSFAKQGSSIFIQKNETVNEIKSLSTKDKKIHFLKCNLAVTCSTLVLSCHVKEFELLKFCHGINQCLLSDPTQGNVFAIGNAISDLEGCYLYWDTVGKRFIGKVTGGKRGSGGRTFATRNKEHKKGSELKSFQDMQSKFYSRYMYPSIESTSKTTEP